MGNLKRKYVYADKPYTLELYSNGNCWSFFIEEKIQGIEEEKNLKNEKVPLLTLVHGGR